MRRTSAMTTGFVLIFLGLQLNLVDTFVLTPRFSNFLAENTASVQPAPTTAMLPQFTPNQPMGQYNGNPNFQNPNSPFSQASFPQNSMQQNPMIPMASVAAPRAIGPKTFSPPKWLCWPILFMGTVVFLHGLSMRRN